MVKRETLNVKVKREAQISMHIVKAYWAFLWKKEEGLSAVVRAVRAHLA